MPLDFDKEYEYAEYLRHEKDSACCLHKDGDPQLESVVSHLTFNRSGEARHKCAYCAYYRGFDDGFESDGVLKDGDKVDFRLRGDNCGKHAGGVEKLEAVMKELPFNENGVGRHRCAYCAYFAGFEEGVRQRTDSHPQ